MSLPATPFHLTATPDTLETWVNAEASSVFICLRTRHQGTQPYHYIQVQLTAEQAAEIVGNLQAAIQDARAYGFIEWIQQDSPELWARWLAEPKP